MRAAWRGLRAGDEAGSRGPAVGFPGGLKWQQRGWNDISQAKATEIVNWLFHATPGDYGDKSELAEDLAHKTEISQAKAAEVLWWFFRRTPYQTLHFALKSLDSV